MNYSSVGTPTCLCHAGANKLLLDFSLGFRLFVFLNFSLVNLYFVSLIHRAAAGRSKRERGERFFFPPFYNSDHLKHTLRIWWKSSRLFLHNEATSIFGAWFYPHRWTLSYHSRILWCLSSGGWSLEAWENRLYWVIQFILTQSNFMMPLHFKQS